MDFKLFKGRLIDAERGNNVKIKIMTREDKLLLLKDLCARLPYDVKVAFQVGDNMPDIRIFTGKDYDYLKYYHFIDEFTNCTFKPYLRPMSSMTEVERLEYGLVLCDELPTNQFDWLNAHHFDHHGLIPKGLAIEVNESNNPYKGL